MRVARRNPQSVEAVTPPFRSVAFMLSSLGYTISRRFHEVLRPLELEPGEFALLRAVSANEGEAQNALAEQLHISPSWMVTIVDELEKRGLLERRPHARDRRVRNLHLTAAGKKLLKRAEKQAEQFDRQVAEQFDEAELGRVLDLLDRVAEGLELQPGAHAAMRERP
jgi:DNA-binding MarR family transcriptional regulator